MKKKRISALMLALLLLLSLLSGCGKEEETAEVAVDAALVGDFATLDPAYCTTAAEKPVSRLLPGTDFCKGAVEGFIHIDAKSLLLGCCKSLCICSHDKNNIRKVREEARV